jgi:glutathione peroxidase-family protein
MSLLSRLVAAVSFCGCCTAEVVAPTDLYTIPVLAIDEQPYDLGQHRGQVLLFVNVASECGFTGQYAGLQQLYLNYQTKGLTIIGVPSNDFGLLSGQEPGSNAEIKTFCSTKFRVTFPMMAKVAVKGDGMHPLYRFLTSSAPGQPSVSWNFNKFLVGRDGKVISHFGSRVKPDDQDLLTAIEAALAAPAPGPAATPNP